MKYAIITPTFRGHFNFIKIYLESFDKYVIDKENIVLYFTINRNEVEEFKKIISSYVKCNIKILILDDILKKNKIYLHPDNLLKKYGKFSFQTIKKLYSVLEINERYSLILDSESSWVKETNMSALFEQYFINPKLYYSEIDKDRFSHFSRNEQHNIDIIAGHRINVWFLENFMWYYDKNILLDMIEEYGDIYSVVDRVYHEGRRVEGVFEILLYSNFIYDNYKKYNYEIINVTQRCKNNLSPYVWENYFFEVSDRLQGSFGLLEQTMMMLNDNNVYELAELYKTLGFNIIRCEVGPMNKNAEKFVDIVKPNIFAASQEHCFGVLADVRNRVGFGDGLTTIVSRFISKDRVKQIMKKLLPGYKVACECRDFIFENRLLIYKIVELEHENMRLLEEIKKGKE